MFVRFLGTDWPKSFEVVDAVVAVVVAECVGKQVVGVQVGLEVMDGPWTGSFEPLVGRSPSFGLVVGMHMASGLSHRLIPYSVPARDLVGPCLDSS